MQNICEFFVVADELQQRLTSRTGLADTEKVFCSGVERFNQQIVVGDDDARAQAVNDIVLRRRIAATI